MSWEKSNRYRSELPAAGETWIYMQSLRPYKVISVQNGDVLYEAATFSIGTFGKKFLKTITEFKEKFVHPDQVTDELIQKSIQENMKMQGLI